MRCEQCVLEVDSPASLDDFFEGLSRCTECPILQGEQASPLVRLLIERHRQSARALRKLGNRARTAENELAELRAESNQYENRISVLEGIQKASALEVEYELAARSEQLRKKEREIVALSTPIIHVWHGVLVVPVIGEFDDERTRIALESLLNEVTRTGTKHVIIDFTAVAHADAGTAERLARVASAIRLLGGEIIISGLQSRVAQTMASMGVAFTGVRTVRSLAQALKLVLSGSSNAT